MRLILRPRDLSETSLRQIRQFGVEDVCVTAWCRRDSNQGTNVFSSRNIDFNLETLLSVKRHLGSYGLRLSSVYLSKLDLARFLMGEPDGGKDLDAVCRSIEAIGKAGIPVLEHCLLVSAALIATTGLPQPGFWSNPAGRGGARLHSYDHARATSDAPVGIVSEDKRWELITRFQERCVPVASECGVRLACHPDDPPVANHWGVAQVLTSISALDRLLNIVPSEYSGLLFCVGTMQEAGVDVIKGLRHFGSMGKIFDIDLRNVRGTVPKYDEVFLDEGDCSMWEVVKTLKEVDYQWTIEPDHVPEVDSEAGGSEVSRAWAVGYIKGLLSAAADFA